MRYLLVIALFALALPAAAQEDTQIVKISHNTVETHAGPVVAHKVEDISGNTTDIRTSINGHYLWVTFGEVDDSYDVDLSVDISDVTITQAIVSLDGTVTLVRTAPEPVNDAPGLDNEPYEFRPPASSSLTVARGTPFGVRAE